MDIICTFLWRGYVVFITDYGDMWRLKIDGNRLPMIEKIGIVNWPR